jgi:CO dehydrogenase/acetyl-CoA synthase delta subunit
MNSRDALMLILLSFDCLSNLLNNAKIGEKQQFIEQSQKQKKPKNKTRIKRKEQKQKRKETESNQTNKTYNRIKDIHVAITKRHAAVTNRHAQTAFYQIERGAPIKVRIILDHFMLCHISLPSSIKT